MDLQRTKVLCFCDGDFYKVGTWLVEFANWRAEAFAAQARRSPGARASPRYTRRDAAIAIHLAVLAVLAHVVVNLAHFRPDNRPSECALLFCSKKKFRLTSIAVVYETLLPCMKALEALCHRCSTNS